MKKRKCMTTLNRRLFTLVQFNWIFFSLQALAATPLVPDANHHLKVVPAHVEHYGSLKISIKDLKSIEFEGDFHTLKLLLVSGNAALTSLTIPPLPALTYLDVIDNAALASLTIPPLQELKHLI